MIPMPSPAAQAIQNDVSRASSAAATRLASSVFTIESSLVESPPSSADSSFSDAALVASPNRVQRYTAASTAATAITIPARMNRSMGTTEPNTSTVSLGKIEGCGFWVVPKASSMDAWATRSTPSDDTSLASGAALRSGLKATSSISAPITSVTTSVIRSAGAVPNSVPNSPVLSDQNVYPASMATPPVAML